MTPIIGFYFDFISPYTYLASQSLPRIAEAHGTEIDYRPFDLVALMPLVGNRPTTLECEAKGAYAITDLVRWATRTGTAFVPNPHWPTIDFPRLARGALVALERNSGSVYVEAIFKALWGEAVDQSGQDRLIAILDAAGLEGADLLRAADDADHIAQVKQATAAAAERGIFGSPTIFVGKEMFFGNDRLDFVIEALREAQAASEVAVA